MLKYFRGEVEQIIRWVYYDNALNGLLFVSAGVPVAIKENKYIA